MNHRVSFLLVVAMITVWAGCGSESSLPQNSQSPTVGNAGSIESTPLLSAAVKSTPHRFTLLSAAGSGIDFVHSWSPPKRRAKQLRGAFTGCGVAIGDFNNDGRPDVFLTRQSDGGRLYENIGQLQFQDVTEKAGMTAPGMWSTGASWVDIDNDDDLDLYVCGFDCPNLLYINQGDGTFHEQASTAGLDFNGASVMMAFADYDLDGDLDGYLLTNRIIHGSDSMSAPADFKYRAPNGKTIVRPEFREYVDVINFPDGSHQIVNSGQYDHLFRNDGPGTDGQVRFTEVTEAAGIDGNHYGLSATWWDYNQDGRPDLYVANDFFGPDQLYRNDGPNKKGHVKFSEVIAETMPHTPWFSMGADISDIDNDGLIDLMGSDMAGTNHYRDKMSMGNMGGPNSDAWFLNFPSPPQYMRNALYRNTGTGRFMEIANLAGLAKTDWTWTIRFADLDNDGREDLFVTNGMSRDWLNADLLAKARELQVPGDSAATDDARQAFWRDQPRYELANIALQNKGDYKFQDVSQSWGLARKSVSYGAALGDLDNDGDLDLVVNNFEEPVSLYRNDSKDGKCFRLRLQGTVSNRWGIGATVHLQAAGATNSQMRFLTLSRGFMSASDPIVHFGVGHAEIIDQLTIQWPSGAVQTFNDLESDKLYTVTEPISVDNDSLPDSKDDRMLFAQVNLPFITHREEPYNDFAHQPLLPNKYSQLGPGIAVADVNGDGHEDLYLGAAAGKAATVHLFRPSSTDGQRGHFQQLRFAAFEEDAPAEDMAPLFFDVDSDGDLDLYVVSGSVECEPGDAVLRDRLYLNKTNEGGELQFAAAPPDALPEVFDSGSVVTAADFDHDGDLDLFVGGRIIPGRYPATPNSRLLRNDTPPGGSPRLIDVTDQLAAGLRETGLVTGAVWSDTDQDGWLDLVVTHEWGPVKLLRNSEGQLQDVTKESGLADRLGWYNSIAARDLDGDGDMDYVVTNFGLNTKYKASPEAPQLLYYGDFDNTGKKHLVEAKFELLPNLAKICYPVRGLSCSSGAMPTIRKRLPTFHQFASNPLEKIYGEDRLAAAQKFECNSLTSGILINDGQGRFDFRPLPRIAQASPCFGVVTGDFNGDALVDIYAVQNFFGPQRETGYMDGGVSTLLLGSGDQQGPRFQPLRADRSGLVVSGDAKGLATTDLNGDGWLDFLVGINNGQLMAFENRALSSHQPLLVRLVGSTGNPTAVGARVTVQLQSGPSQTAEVHAGSGYLSQTTAALQFGVPDGDVVDKIEVRWPGGARTTHPGPTQDGETILEIQQAG